LIGYAAAVQAEVNTAGWVSWITQLVVHKNYRQRGVAQQLLKLVSNSKAHFACGLASANPFAVSALEKATGWLVEPRRILKHKTVILDFACQYVPYVNCDTQFSISDKTSTVNTCLFVDHSEVKDGIQSLNAKGQAWSLGDLSEGWEWLAFAFKPALATDSLLT
jgi:hypothetical protein